MSTQHLNAKLLIVGDGSQKKSLHDLVKTLKIEERVVFAGFRYDAYKFYPIFDCFALSSQSEGLSIALLEAMALKLPVISTNSDIQNHDVIKPGINGFLVAPYDIKGYAAAINKLFQYHQEDRRMIQSIGECNFTCVKTEFCINEVVNRYQKLYQDVVKSDFSKKL